MIALQVADFTCQGCYEPRPINETSVWNGHYITVDKGSSEESIQVHALCVECLKQPLTEEFLLKEECFSCKQKFKDGQRSVFQINATGEIIDEQLQPSVTGCFAMIKRTPIVTSIAVIAVGGILGGGLPAMGIIVAVKLGISMPLAATLFGIEVSGIIVGSLVGALSQRSTILNQEATSINPPTYNLVSHRRFRPVF